MKVLHIDNNHVVFALDVSKSMLAEDIAPNRLEKAKQIISKTIDKLGSDRVGIIIYAGNSYPLLPITTDHAAANMFLQNAAPEMVSSQGTAINEALELAKTYYNNDEQTNRFLIIISDGEDHQEETKQMAQNLANEGVKIFTIGIGTEKGGPIPLRINGSMIGYKKDRKGETVITKRTPKVLEGIANAANGKYIDGNVTQKPVNIISEIIANAEKNEFETKQFADYKDQFPAMQNHNRYSALLTLGIAATFFFYFSVNMLMVMGLAPVVGVPLPLVSYGGSAMLVLLGAFGLVQSAHIHRAR